MSVASELQAILLSELSAHRPWRREEIVLHGGSSLKYRWGSPRFSEDLDFMVAPAHFADLERVGGACVERLRRAAAPLWPGCEIAWRAVARGGEDEGGDALHRWDIRWYHPMRQGKVMVKMEFWRTAPEHLVAYASRVHVGEGRVGRFRLSAPFPMPELAGLWGDKVKAVATRPAMKWRDCYDLAFLRDAIEARELDDLRLPPARRTDVRGGLLRALETSAAIYGHEPSDILPKLRSVFDSGVLDDYASFAENMQEWFDPSTRAAWSDQGYVADRLDAARMEIERGAELLEMALSPAEPGAAGVAP